MLVEFYQAREPNKMYPAGMPSQERVMAFLKTTISGLPFASRVRIEPTNKHYVFRFLAPDSYHFPKGPLDAQLKKALMEYMKKTEKDYGFRIRFLEATSAASEEAPNSTLEGGTEKIQKTKDSNKTYYYVGGAVLATALVTVFVMKSRRQ